MNATRVSAAPGAGCPVCEGSEAIVRVRGERMGVTCTSCRHSEIVPLRAASCEPGSGRDSHDALADELKSALRARDVHAAHVSALGVKFRAPLVP